MVNVSNCNNQASKLEDAAKNISSIISIYEDAYDEIKNNESAQINSIKTDIKTKITLLENIKKDLNNQAQQIRTKAQEIYNQQLKEEELKKQQTNNQ